MIAIDASTLIDVLFGTPRADVSAAAVRNALQVGPVVICDVVAAELAGRGNSQAILDSVKELGIQYSMLEERSAMRAGEMANRFRMRQRRKGHAPRERIIPDFLIGAHALLQCQGLVTHDGGFHRDYFKGLRVIVPGEP